MHADKTYSQECTPMNYNKLHIWHIYEKLQEQSSIFLGTEDGLITEKVMVQLKSYMHHTLR